MFGARHGCLRTGGTRRERYAADLKTPAPLRVRLKLMRFYNNVAELRLFRGGTGRQCTKFCGPRRSAGGTDHLDLQLANLLAQGVAIDAQEIGGADLVAARGREHGR